MDRMTITGIVPGRDNKARSWELHERGRLVATTLYRVGAREVASRITQARADRTQLLRLKRAVESLPISPGAYLVDPPAWDRVTRLLAGIGCR